MRPRVAITLGDPRGIGPEIVASVMTDPPAGAEYVLVGPADLLAGLPGETLPVGSAAAGGWDASEAGMMAAGRQVGAQIETVVEHARIGDLQAVVTAPAEKRALHAAGYRYPGHTEWLAALTGTTDVAMMLVTERLRVVLATTHIPLKDVPGALTVERVTTVGVLAREALTSWWGIGRPRLAICGLNPHAGEGGLFGSEDRDVLAPAAAALGAVGPVPADTVFVRAMAGEFDAVIAPYHDVGMTAVKVAGFGSGVNITLGLPFIRTAPDHGTALDIAGQGKADPGSMRAAVTLAVRLATRR
ncbi:MAG TPA: 4-hydroxythreonine-4-phosphate dehydrogenase PdxA [Gemmatimonadales bacterium]